MTVASAVQMATIVLQGKSEWEIECRLLRRFEIGTHGTEPFSHMYPALGLYVVYPQGLPTRTKSCAVTVRRASARLQITRSPADVRPGSGNGLRRGQESAPSISTYLWVFNIQLNLVRYNVSEVQRRTVQGLHMAPPQ